jgi:hypothetical protein
MVVSRCIGVCVGAYGYVWVNMGLIGVCRCI